MAAKKFNAKTSTSASKKTRKRRKRRTWHDDEFEAVSNEAKKIHEKYGKAKKKSLLDDVLDCEASCSSSLLNGENESTSTPLTNVHRTHGVTFKEDIVPGSWVCSLCGKGMAFEKLGDLFGPYYISTPRRVPEYLLPPKEPKLHLYQKKSRQPNFECWFHGPCAIWAADLFLEGIEMVDLEEKMAKFWEQKCEMCLQPGASISCDSAFLHFQCAKDNPKYYSLNPSSLTCERVVATEPGSPLL